MVERGSIQGTAFLWALFDNMIQVDMSSKMEKKKIMCSLYLNHFFGSKFRTTQFNIHPKLLLPIKNSGFVNFTARVIRSQNWCILYWFGIKSRSTFFFLRLQQQYYSRYCAISRGYYKIQIERAKKRTRGNNFYMF